MKFSEYIKNMGLAIDDEINAEKGKKDLRILITNGQILNYSENELIYKFDIETDVKLQDDMPVILYIEKKEYKGNILYADEQHIILKIFNFNGAIIKNANISFKSYFIFEQLKERLNEIKNTKNINYPKMLIDPDFQLEEKYKKYLYEVEIEENCEYNKYQYEAVLKIFKNPITFVWGPPGTGKTKTLALSAKYLYKYGEKILVLSHSNIAVDVALLNIANNLIDLNKGYNGEIIKYGSLFLKELEEKYPYLSIDNNIIQNIPELESKYLKIKKLIIDLNNSNKNEKDIYFKNEKIIQEIQYLRNEIYKKRDIMKEIEKEILNKSIIIGCTLSKAILSEEIYNKQFDVIFIDEASMAYIPYCIFFASLAKKRIVFFGDFLQLPPIVQAETELSNKWLKRDIFTQSKIKKNVINMTEDKRLVLLPIQYRMHPDISSLINKLFYMKKLIDSKDIKEKTQHIIDQEPAPGNSLILYDISNLKPTCWKDMNSLTKSRFNIISAIYICNILKALKNNNLTYGIITPYRSQERLIKAIIKDLEYSNIKDIKIATVHKFQGSESDVIIFDFVDSNPNKNLGKLLKGNNVSPTARLANVSLSRAKGKFIAVGDLSYLKSKFETDDIFQQIINEIENTGKIIKPLDLNKNISGSNDLKKIRKYSNCDECLDDLINDLHNSYKFVSIYSKKDDLPFPKDVFNKNCPENINIYVSDKHYNIIKSSHKNAIRLDNKYFITSDFISIDNSILWLFMNTNILRLQLGKTVELLNQYLDLIPEKEKRIIRSSKDINSPLGYCPKCGSKLDIDKEEYEEEDLEIIQCVDCSYYRKITVEDLTSLARYYNITCDKCGSIMRGCKNKYYSTLFLGCSNYPKCSSIIYLNELNYKIEEAQEKHKEQKNNQKEKLQVILIKKNK
jgi:superfamily I DNA and/or RNA helicase/ssDNA-binding Zn-finger/Zn-ribbon topoisomerase 1